MIDLPHGRSGLSRATWTDADFASMGWHDCRIHAISIGEYDDDTLPRARMLLDLDYIVRWVQPRPGEKGFSFWIAPATLVFEAAWDIKGGSDRCTSTWRSRTFTGSTRPTAIRIRGGISRARTSTFALSPTGES